MLSDDVLLNFVGAAINRRLAIIEITQRRARLRAKAYPVIVRKIERVLGRDVG